MENTFETLKKFYGSHRKAAKALFVSYTRYNEWRWRPDEIPARSRNYIEMAAMLAEMKTVAMKENEHV